VTSAASGRRSIQLPRPRLRRLKKLTPFRCFQGQKMGKIHEAMRSVQAVDKALAVYQAKSLIVALHRLTFLDAAIAAGVPIA
jgi:hypothetical protein